MDTMFKEWTGLKLIDNLGAKESTIFGSKKYNDVGNTFINPLYNYAAGGYRDLFGDISLLDEYGMSGTKFIGQWEEECRSRLENTATVDIRMNARQVMVTTKTRKLSFSGVLGNIGKLENGRLTWFCVMN